MYPRESSAASSPLAAAGRWSRYRAAMVNSPIFLQVRSERCRTLVQRSLSCWVWGLLSWLVLAPSPVWAELRILCLGDSLTEGYGVEAEQAYPALVEKKLRASGHDVRVINAGISGSTSASGLSRLRWQLRSKPDVLVLALGANDGLRGLAVDQTKQNLADVIERSREEGVRVLIAGMKMPPNYGPEYTRAFEEIFSSLSQTHGVPLIPFLLEGVAARQNLNLPDGIHPNARGHEIVAETVLSHLEPLL
ncbi:arylesterase [Myxococcota bacterium]|nr:arylesterase [Myxococcota bacterium]